MATAEQLVAIRAGVRHWNQWRREHSDTIIDLAEAHLCKAYLPEVSLNEAVLTRADLSGANLFQANLAGANLAEADLFETNLSRANLHGASLVNANGATRRNRRRWGGVRPAPRRRTAPARPPEPELARSCPALPYGPTP